MGCHLTDKIGFTRKKSETPILSVKMKSHTIFRASQKITAEFAALQTLIKNRGCELKIWIRCGMDQQRKFIDIRPFLSWSGNDSVFILRSKSTVCVFELNMNPLSISCLIVFFILRLKTPKVIFLALIWKHYHFYFSSKMVEYLWKFKCE